MRVAGWRRVLAAGIALAAVAAFSTPAWGQPKAQASGAKKASGMVHVVMTTELGVIELDIDAAHAPVTAANFLRYVRKGVYDGGVFHRTVTRANQPKNKVKIEVIQGGKRPGPKEKSPDFAPIQLERTSVTGLRHVEGAISMARDGPDTATSDFFLCIAAQPELDFGGHRNPDGQGFAAFGKVTRGMEVARRIQGSRAEGQRLTPPIKIIRVRVEDHHDAPKRSGGPKSSGIDAAPSKRGGK